MYAYYNLSSILKVVTGNYIKLRVWTVKNQKFPIVTISFITVIKLIRKN